MTSVPGTNEEHDAEKCAALCHFAFDMIEAIQSYCKDNPHRALDMVRTAEQISFSKDSAVRRVLSMLSFFYC